jgi:hypothetical protein
MCSFLKRFRDGVVAISFLGRLFGVDSLLTLVAFLGVLTGLALGTSALLRFVDVAFCGVLLPGLARSTEE